MKVLCISWVGYLYEPGKLYPLDSKGRVISPSKIIQVQILGTSIPGNL
jgi:hypothetical protein